MNLISNFRSDNKINEQRADKLDNTSIEGQDDMSDNIGRVGLKKIRTVVAVVCFLLAFSGLIAVSIYLKPANYADRNG